MGSRRDKKLEARAKRRAAKEAAMRKPGAQSRYAKKRAWLNANPHTRRTEDGKTVLDPRPGDGDARKLARCWGFDVESPKPWA